MIANGGSSKLTGMRKLAAAVAWRGFWRAEDTLRELMWKERLGFELRERPGGSMAVAEPRIEPAAAPSPVSRTPRSSDLGVVDAEDSHPSMAAEVGRFYGLDVHRSALQRADSLLEQAMRERWPLVSVKFREGQGHPGGWENAARAYLEAGGTLLIEGVAIDANDAIQRLSTAIGKSLPVAHQMAVEPTEAVFSGADPGFTQEFAGVSVRLSGTRVALETAGPARVLCSARGRDEVRAVLVEIPVGHGRVVMSSRAPEVDSLARAVAPLNALSVLPAMMLVKQVYGQVAWRSPHPLACFVIDDPALRCGRLGLDYPRVLSQARRHGFHVTVATIPRELGLADPAVVDLLRREGRWISACYHGNDHSGYEFYLPEGRRMRYRTRAIPAQEEALRHAVERGEDFARRTGLALDRVMVFPHGIGPSAVLRSLQDLGFIAACNFDDRYPLGSTVPDEFDLGLRPTDLAWAGFPLMWRRGLSDPMFVLDLFLGRPAITFGHPKALGPDVDQFVRRTEEIRRVADVQWTSLEDVSRHTYLQRYDPKSGWQVAMMSNEICLHNPAETPRTYSVKRRYLPSGFEVVADGRYARTPGGVEVTIPPDATCTIRVRSAGSGSLTQGRPCAIGARDQSTAR